MSSASWPDSVVERRVREEEEEEAPLPRLSPPAEASRVLTSLPSSLSSSSSPPSPPSLPL